MAKVGPVGEHPDQKVEKVDHPDQEVDMDRAACTGRQLDRWECWNPRNTEKEKDD